MGSVLTELESAYYSSIKELKGGGVVQGKIVSVTSKEVVVDVGYKSEGIISREEFQGVDIDSLEEIDVYVENVEDEDGRVVLSFKKAKQTKGWRNLVDNYKEGDLIKGTVLRKIRGGYIVSVFGVEGFLPQSLASFRNISDAELIRKEFHFQVARMNVAKESFILSRKDAVRMEREVLRKKIWQDLEAGTVMKGRIKSVTNFGAFIDLGGVDGLLHIADMSWKKITHPSEIVAVGDEIQVKILNFDREKGKISLGLKQTTPDPWVEIDRKYLPSSIIKGRITNIQNYGIFVELEKGIEGLVHISEVSWTKRFVNLGEIFAIGDIVEVKVINVDPKQRKISLTIKQLECDPWEDIENLIAIDSQAKGKIIGYGEGCAYTELESGLEGVIYNEDISWTKKISRAQEILKRGANFEFKVLGIDKSKKKIILGRKQLEKDPWPEILEEYPVGRVLETEVAKIVNFGVFVKIEEALEGLIFSDEIDGEVMDKLKIKDKIKVKIMRVDPDSAKIGLSAKIDESS